MLLKKISQKIANPSPYMTRKEFEKFNMKFNEPFGVKENGADSNMILTERTRISLYAPIRNANALIVGGSKKDIDQSVILPNLLQAYGSYVVTDPDGYYMAATRRFFSDQGYRIHVLNLKDPAMSDPYNPFQYIYSDMEACGMAECILRNTDEKTDSSFIKAEFLLIRACICLLYCCSKEERNFETLMQILKDGQIGASENTNLDRRFKKIGADQNSKTCIWLYTKFCTTCENINIRKSVINSAIERLSVFDNVKSNAWKEDRMDLESVGKTKTVIYVIPPKEKELKLFMPLFYYQALHALMRSAEERKTFPMEQRVLFFMNEFADYGIIPEIGRTLHMIRPYGIACMMFASSIGEIQKLYGDDCDIICNATTALLLFRNTDEKTFQYLKQITKLFEWNHMNKRDMLSKEKFMKISRNQNVLCGVTGNKLIRDKKICLKKHPNAGVLSLF